MYTIPMQWEHPNQAFLSAINWEHFHKWRNEQPNETEECQCEKKAA